MGDLFESFLRVAMLVLIVGPLTAWIARRAARECKEATDSLEHFTVRMPAAPRVVLAACAVLFELIMLAVYVWQGLSLGIWDHALVWFGHAMALAGMGIWALVSLPRLDVDGEHIVIRTALGRRKRAMFSQITRATLHTQMMSVVLYAGDCGGERKLATVNLEGTCATNLLARLAQEGIEVADAVQAPMTKARLCWAAIKPLTLVFVGMAVVFSLVIAFMALFTDEGAGLLVIIPFLFILIGGVLPLIMLSMPIRGAYEITLQERELGFSFAQEMAARGATGTEFEDDDWFVSISNARIVAFRRDYIKRLSAVEGTESGDRCVVTAKNGKKHKVYAAGSTLEDLRTWYRRGPRQRSMADRAADALETLV